MDETGLEIMRAQVRKNGGWRGLWWHDDRTRTTIVHGDIRGFEGAYLVFQTQTTTTTRSTIYLNHRNETRHTHIMHIHNTSCSLKHSIIQVEALTSLGFTYVALARHVPPFLSSPCCLSPLFFCYLSSPCKTRENQLIK